MGGANGGAGGKDGGMWGKQKMSAYVGAKVEWAVTGRGWAAKGWGEPEEHPALGFWSAQLLSNSSTPLYEG